MQSISGKILVFTDQHFGIKGNSPLRQKIGAMVIKKILDYIDKEKTSNIVFCGDYFHQRNALTVDTLNIAYRCLQALSKKCKVYMILGNHDLFNKNSTDVNSINIFRDNSNICVVDSPIDVDMNGKKALFVPWLSDLSDFKKESYDFMFGHFDISTRFLITDYVQEHSRSIQASNEISNALDQDDNLGKQDSIENKNGELLGSFIEMAKKDGTIFAGHIHQHKEMVVKGRRFIFVGSPYQQNLGEIGCRCGFYAIDADGRYKFIEIDGIPKHIQFKSSEIEKQGIENFDFSIAKGNIVQKVYDSDISSEDDIAISKKISQFKPYEELLPDYQVALDLTKNSVEHEDNLVKMLKKSKFDYIESYISQLDSSMLKDHNIEKSKLVKLMEKYYKAVAGE